MTQSSWSRLLGWERRADIGLTGEMDGWGGLVAGRTGRAVDGRTGRAGCHPTRRVFNSRQTMAESKLRPGNKTAVAYSTHVDSTKIRPYTDRHVRQTALWRPGRNGSRSLLHTGRLAAWRWIWDGHVCCRCGCRPAEFCIGEAARAIDHVLLLSYEYATIYLAISRRKMDAGSITPPSSSQRIIIDREN